MIYLFVQAVVFQVLLLTGFDSLVSSVGCLWPVSQDWLDWLIGMKLGIELVFEKGVAKSAERQLLSFFFCVWQVRLVFSIFILWEIELSGLLAY